MTADEQLKKRVRYEWHFEQWDKHGDIQDSGHIDLSEWPYHAIDDCEVKLVLRRYYYSYDNGVFDIGYAYYENGQLSPLFDNGCKVPKAYLTAVIKLGASQ